MGVDIEVEAKDAAPRFPRLSRSGDRVSSCGDGMLEVAVAGFAVWTILYWLALLGLPLIVAQGAGGIAVLVLAILRYRRPWLPQISGRGVGGWVVAATALGAAVLASAIVRPDLDDASYVARASYVADFGIIGAPDSWPRSIGPEPYLASFEAALGSIAGLLSTSGGAVSYVLFPPIGAAVIVWALWMCFRAMEARRPELSTLLAVAWLFLGGTTHASWGNLSFARIWQGKIVLVAILIPLAYALIMLLNRERKLSLRGGIALAVIGVAGVGLTSTAVFLIPIVACIGAAPALFRQRWLWFLKCVGLMSIAPLLSGGLMFVLPSASVGMYLPVEPMWMWEKAVGQGWPAVIAVMAAAIVVLGVIIPRQCGALGSDSQRALAISVTLGLLVSVPVFAGVLERLVGTDAIAWRLTWMVPMSIVVGAVASLPVLKWGLPAIPVTGMVILLIGFTGNPLWDSTNGASLERPGVWKVIPEDLAAANRIVEIAPSDPYLAPVTTTAAVDAITTSYPSVAGRYLEVMPPIDGLSLPDRGLLQRFAEGDRSEDVLAAVAATLRRVDIAVVCVRADESSSQRVLSATGFGPPEVIGTIACRTR